MWSSRTWKNHETRSVTVVNRIIYEREISRYLKREKKDKFLSGGLKHLNQKCLCSNNKCTVIGLVTTDYRCFHMDIPTISSHAKCDPAPRIFISISVHAKMWFPPTRPIGKRFFFRLFKTKAHWFFSCRIPTYFSLSDDTIFGEKDMSIDSANFIWIISRKKRMTLRHWVRFCWFFRVTNVG